jgi:antirestriction protein
LDYVHDVACFIEEYPVIASELISHFCDLDEARQAAEEDYNGCYRSLADYVQELTEETTEIPKSLEFYIDYEHMAKDMGMSGDIFTIQTAHDEVHVFWSR